MTSTCVEGKAEANAKAGRGYSRDQRPAKSPGVIKRRIDRWLGRYPGAEKPFEVNVELNAAGRACGLKIGEKPERQSWAGLAHGAYLLCTNCTENDPAQLWRWYIHLTQAEECFKISKSDLHLRPVFHQTTKRVEAHILVCFLTLALWRTLEMWMKGKGLGDCARQLIKEVATVRSLDERGVGMERGGRGGQETGDRGRGPQSAGRGEKRRRR